MLASEHHPSSRALASAMRLSFLSLTESKIFRIIPNSPMAISRAYKPVIREISSRWRLSCLCQSLGYPSILAVDTWFSSTLQIVCIFHWPNWLLLIQYLSCCKWLLHYFLCLVWKHRLRRILRFYRWGRAAKSRLEVIKEGGVRWELLLLFCVVVERQKLHQVLLHLFQLCRLVWVLHCNALILWLCNLQLFIHLLNQEW
jgi:hypothetical protein